MAVIHLVASFNSIIIDLIKKIVKPIHIDFSYYYFFIRSLLDKDSMLAKTTHFLHNESKIKFKGDNNPVQFCFVGFSSDVICQVNLMETCGTSYPKILDQPIINIHGPGQRYLQDYFTLFSNVTNDETVDLHPDRKSTRLNSSHL